MRWVACAIAIAGCAPVWEPPRRPDKRPHDTRPIELSCDENGCVGRRHDVVTEPGGDAFDWFTVDIPRACGGERAELVVHDEPARPGMAVHVTVLDEKLRPAARPRRVGAATARIGLWFNGGRYYVGVRAARGQAGTYQLELITDGTSRCAGREIVLVRPDDETLPPVATAAVLVPVTQAGAGAHAPPSLVVDASDPRVQPGAHGVVLDERGKKIRHSELVIDERFARGDAPFASARFVRPDDMQRRMLLGWTGWTIALDRK